MHSAKSTASEVARVLRMHTFNFDNEDELQQGIAKALELAGAPFSREVRLSPRDRIDFVVHARHEIGIEVKVTSTGRLLAQVKRYLESDQIEGIVIVTTARAHKRLSGDHLWAGKSCEVVWLGFSSL